MIDRGVYHHVSVKRLFRLIYDRESDTLGQKREWEKGEGAAGRLKYRVSLLEASIDEPSVDASTVIVTGAMQKSSWPTRLCVQFIHVSRHTVSVHNPGFTFIILSVCSCRSRTCTPDLDRRSIDRYE